MQDRLAWMFKRFSLSAHTFHAGAIERPITTEPSQGLGYLYLLTSGSIRITDSQQSEVRISQPSAILYLDPAYIDISPEIGGAKLICASFEFGLNKGNPLAGSIQHMHLLKLAQANILGGIYDQLCFEAFEQHCGRQAVLDRLIEVILILLLRDLMDNQRLHIGLFAGLSDGRLYKALNAIHKLPAEQWTIESMSTRAGMSRSRFAEHFHNVVGMTPAQYLTKLRLGLAENYLLQGKSLSQVADGVGYASASALSRAFSNQYGMPPKSWAKKYSTR